MEEKRYPQLNEEQDHVVCCEPIAEAMVDYAISTSRWADGETKAHDWIDNLDWDHLPILGPKTEKEAIARIERAEAELDNPAKWVTSEQMWAELHQEFPWLR
ncbi:MAG: hypothetical protein IJV34_08710 [Prevotella sp.]|nr:hypothetical protein [Prevotella sp.]